MTDHQHLAEGYGDASVPCSTTTGAITARDDEVQRLLKAQTYKYIGKDGKPVLARDLEDDRDALKAEVKRLRDALWLAGNRIMWCAGILPSDKSRDQATLWWGEVNDVLSQSPKGGD